MKMYKEAVGDDNKIKAYINVGGNMASIGLKQPQIKSSDIDNVNDNKKSKKSSTSSADESVIKLPSFPTGVTKSLPQNIKQLILLLLIS